MLLNAFSIVFLSVLYKPIHFSLFQACEIGQLIERNNKQYMKLKQPNYQRKHFVLPYIKNFEPNRFTPRRLNNNRSLPKIPSSFPQQMEQNNNPQIYKQLNPDKQKIRQKLKAVYKKKNIIALNNLQTESNCNTVDQPSITNQFQKEIQRNLMIIKREKENKQFNRNVKKMRYNSPPPIAISTDQFTANNKKQPRCATQQDVFSRINNIIMKSQSRSALLIDQSTNVQLSSVSKKENRKHPIQIKKSKRRIITDVNLPSDIKPKQISQKPIKHQGNYCQWRKVSIDYSQNGRIKYDISSYEMQTDRLEKIRSKNDLSLKKYFQDKTYLNKLLNYRDSSSKISKHK